MFALKRLKIIYNCTGEVPMIPIEMFMAQKVLQILIFFSFYITDELFKYLLHKK